MDRAYIDYEKLEQLSQNGVVYVTKMKKGLKYQVISDVMYMDAKGGMAYRIQEVEFTKKKGRKDDGSADGDKHTGTKGGKMGSEVITHRARIVTYPDVKRRKGKGGKEIVTGKMVSLLTNDFTMEAEDIIAIYKKRWEIETLFRQIKQNFPLRYFYGESANAIKIQIWVTLIGCSLKANHSSLEKGERSQNSRTPIFDLNISELPLNRKETGNTLETRGLTYSYTFYTIPKNAHLGCKGT